MSAVGACAVLAGLAVLLAGSRPDGRRRAGRRLRSIRGPGRPDRSGRCTVRSVVRARRPPAPAPPLSAADVAVLADQVAALAMAGLPPHRIWAAVADHGPSGSARAAAASVVAGRRHGLAPAQALRGHLAAEPGHDPAAVQLAVALDVSERTGAGAAATLHRFAEALRADERAAAERAAALAGPQATAAVLAVLPLAGLLLGVAVGGHPWHALLATAPGRVCLLLGGLLWAAGRRWTRYLVRRAGGPP